MLRNVKVVLFLKGRKEFYCIKKRQSTEEGRFWHCLRREKKKQIRY